MVYGDDSRDKDKLIELYAQELDCAQMDLKYVGLLLDDNLIENSLEYYKIKRLYIYGASYLGVLMARMLKGKVDVSALIDKSKGAKIQIPDVKVLGIDDFCNVYDNEYVIITLGNYYDEIKRDLHSFVPVEKMLLLGEFLGGER